MKTHKLVSLINCYVFVGEKCWEDSPIVSVMRPVPLLCGNENNISVIISMDF